MEKRGRERKRREAVEGDKLANERTNRPTSQLSSSYLASATRWAASAEAPAISASATAGNAAKHHVFLSIRLDARTVHVLACALSLSLSLSHRDHFYVQRPANPSSSSLSRLLFLFYSFPLNHPPGLLGLCSALVWVHTATNITLPYRKSRTTL